MRSCPTKLARQDAEQLGFHFTPAASFKNKTSHFSTLKTMKEWMIYIYIPYITQVIQDAKLPPDQKSILLLDAYPVHIGEELQSYITSSHPNVFVVYVPAVKVLA